MALRVDGATKNRAGEILSLCGDGWSKPVVEVIQDIERGRQSYYVLVAGARAQVYVAGTSRRFLKTRADTTTRNNLDALPPCRA